MLSEEEKKAIEVLKQLPVTLEITHLGGAKEIAIALNLIEKQQSEIEEKDKEIQFQKDINKTEKDRHKKTEKSLKGQIIKQNKIIDLMSEYLIGFAISDIDKDEILILPNKEDVKQYFKKKAEEDKQC